ncbi:hypothetical protein V2W30_40895 (plasmid) [Streptomyces sp. Q6]|uniref:Uncharacterized protein n=1 Tax=Streptomyces citrinus TaxID=3118173 RepID=A0ACD5ARG0_9ACTN
MTSQSAGTLRSRYAVQAASDLAKNRRRQQELTKKLTLLQEEEALLADILKLAEQYEGFGDASRLPQQAQDEPAAATAKQRALTTAGKSAAAGAKKGGAKRKTRRPLLGDVLLELLPGHDEPCPAKELRDELLKKHPSRNPTPQVVRNTLESLVAQGRIRRHKEGRAVTYTVVKGSN